MIEFEQNEGGILRRYCWKIKGSPHNYIKLVGNASSSHPSGTTPSTHSCEAGYQYGTISRHRDHRYINNLPPLSGKSTDVPELLALFTREKALFPLQEKKIKFFQCCQEGGVVEAICEIIQKVFFSKLQNQEWNGKMEKDKWRQGSKGITFQSTEA